MLNVTLIIQLFNFFLAYVLIDRVLLRKAVSIIQTTRQDQDLLMEEIEQERERLTKKELLKEKKWCDFKKIFAQKIPKKQEVPSVKIPDISLEVSMSRSEIDRSSDYLEKIVVQKVIDGV